MRCSARISRFLLLGSGLWLACAATGLAPIADGDIFWHLASGREIWRSGQLLVRDPFSIGAAGRPWTDVHWLFQLGAFSMHAYLGLRGLVLAKCALVGVAACLFVWSNPKNARVLTGLAMVAVLLCARHLLLVRPVIVSMVMLGLFCAQLERLRRHQGGKLWLLPIAQVVWSNCQSLSALGPAVVAAYSVGAVAERLRDARASSYPFAREANFSDRHAQRAYLRTLLSCLSACMLACLVTPFGVSALTLPWRLLARLTPGTSNAFLQVAENVPAFVAERTAAGEFWHVKWFIGLLALSIAARRARVALSELLILVGFTALAVMGNRNVLLLYVVATPIAVRQLLPALRWCRCRLPLLSGLRWRSWSAGVVVLLFVDGLYGAREPRLDEPTPFHFPVESASAIAAHGGAGSIFSADHQGGYLIWTLYPQFRPYFDTRWILRSAQEFSDYLALIDEPSRFDAFAQKHAFTYVVLPVAYPSRYLPLIAHLYRSERWRLVFTNGSEVLFANASVVRARSWDLGSDSTTDAILHRLHSDVDGPELQRAAHIQLAMLEIAVGEYAQAERALHGLAVPAAQALLAQARLLAGDLAGAQQLAEQLLSEGTDEVRSLALLANVSARRHELPEAVGYVTRAAALEPFDDEVARLLRSLEGSCDAR